MNEPRHASHAGGEGFRWDLQGLRAVSVLVVLFFHISESLISGGFFGVDVFFVVSGFVITSLLLREFDQTGTVDVARFYLRRAKRLLPNAALVLVGALVAAALLRPQYHVIELAGDAFAAALYYANFHFAWLKLDYFNSNRAPSALVHYWSLSIEEQFYLFWPVILLAIGGFVSARFRRAAVSIALAYIWIVSFLLCLAVGPRNQPLAFFHSFSRVWELATGALLAAHAPVIRQWIAPYRTLAAWTGAALIALACFFATEKMTHPGWITLAPVLGSALLISAGLGFTGREADAPVVTRALSAAPMVWIGDRSYSFYLWHWPIIVFLKPFVGTTFGLAMLALPLTLLLGSVAYSYVETPIRYGRMGEGAGVLRFAPAAAIMAIVVLATAAAPAIASLVKRVVPDLGDDMVTRAIQDDGGVPYRTKCHRGSEDSEQPDCAFGDATANRQVVLMGDSHAAHLFAPFEKAAKLEGWRLHSWSKSSCPSADITLYNPHLKAPYSTCSGWREGLFARLEKMRPSVVVLSNSNGYGGWAIPYRSNATETIKGREAAKEFEAGLLRSIERLRKMGHTVVIVRDTPLARGDYRDCVSKYGSDRRCGRHISEATTMDNVERRVAQDKPGVLYLDFTEMICERDFCPVVKNGDVIYRDDSHLTVKFAETLFRPIVDVLRRVNLPK